MAAVEAGLPEELMTLILLKLPVKSLLRFKCVQKSWYALIKSPYFTHLHRSFSSTSINYDCFIVRRYNEKQQQNVLSFYSYETLDDMGNEINLPISNYRAWFSGSCDGLVCLTDYNDQILVCNPTIRELRSLVFPPPLGKKIDFSILSVAFGSDPNTAQYKVLMIGVPNHDFGADYDGVSFARLYDFSTDTWRETGADIPPGPFRYSRHAVSFNGAFHWSPLATAKSNSILTFHISNEVTGSIPLPDFVVDFSYDMELCVSPESQISLIFSDYYSEGGFEICVMTQYGVKESWTRLFKTRPLPDFLQPIAFWDEQRLLLRNARRGELVSCDLQYQNLRHFPILGHIDLCPCSQSLVSVFGMGDKFI